MAIIYSYPLKAIPDNDDLLVITDSSEVSGRKNRTKSITVENLADYIITSTTGNITGSGTLRQIPMFTPNGTSIGDSVMFQKSNDIEIQVGVFGAGQETTLGAGYISVNSLAATTINGAEGGTVTLRGETVIGDNIDLPDNLTINASVLDSNGASGSSGEVLVSNASSQVEWKSYAESGATFLGWARYDGTPSFSTGTEVTVLAGNYIDPPVSLVANQIIDPYTNGASGKFNFTNDDLNAVFSLTAVFKASAANANQTHVDVNFISGATAYERLSKSVAFYKGNDTVQNFHEMYQFYVDSDLITYGLQPRLAADGGDVKFGDVIFFIQKQQQPAL